MASRDELAYADMSNDPDANILRLTVRPEGVEAPPTDTGWGGLGPAGRPSGRLFEPDQTPVRPTIGERIGINPIEGWPSPIEGAQALGRGIGGLVQGAGAALNAPPEPPRPTGGMPSSISGLPPRHAVPPPGPNLFEQGAKAIGGIPRQIEQGYQHSATSLEGPPELRELARRGAVESAAEQSMNLAGFGMTGASVRGGASAGVFGGRLSKFHDPDKEKLAQLMEGNGVPPQQIWKDTGYVKFADGKWRHEISDLAASYKGDVDSIAAGIFDKKYPDRAGMYGKYGEGVPTGNVVRSDSARQEALLKIQRKELVVEDVLPHPLLKEAYGDKIMKMPIEHDPTMLASGGYLARHKDTPQGKIAYREEDKPGKLARGITFDTVIHEVQHAIDNIEGHARGANPHYYAPGSAPDKIYQKMMAELPPGVSKKNADLFERYARLHAGMEGYQKSPGEAANIANLRKDFSPQQAAAVFPPAQMKYSLKEQKPFVEFNAPFDPAAQQAQMGGVLNPQMQMSAGPTLRGKAAEEAWRGTEKEPKLRTSVHPYSNVGGTPIREMESPIIKGAPKAHPRLLDVEKDLTNAEFIFTGGDATGAGGKLYGSKSMPFETPVSRHGGPGYGQIMQGKKVEGASGVSPVWASMKGPMGEIYNIARDVERRGKEPWQVYMTGGKQYLDSSLQMVDTALQATKAKGVSDRMNEYLFNVMRSDWNTAADPKRLFPETGLKNEKALREWIENSPQPQRAKLVKAMDSVTARSLGFPDIGQLRVWNTDARMLTAPPGSAGLALARIDPKTGLIPSHHPSYNTAIAGTDVGTLGMQVPHQIIAPTMHKSRMETLNKPQYYQAAPHLYFPGGGTHAKKTEPVTNKLKDILQRWMQDNPGGLAVAGTAGAAGLGSVVAPNRQEVY